MVEVDAATVVRRASGEAGLMSRPVPHLPGYRATEEGQVLNPRGAVVSSRSNGAGQGYLYFSVSTRLGVCRTQAVHVAVCSAYWGPKPFPGAQVRHLDGDSMNNAPSNLSWGTRSDNQRDTQRYGGRPQGKVNRHDVAEIRRLASAAPRTPREKSVGHVNYSEIGRQFGITAQAVRYIVDGATWRFDASS